MINENLQKEIEAYINHDLSNAERSAFENRMTKDPLLRNEVELQSAIISTIQSNGRLSLKHTLEATNVSLVSTAITEAIKIGLGVLASSAVVVGAYFVLQNQTNNNDINSTVSNDSVVESIPLSTPSSSDQAALGNTSIRIEETPVQDNSKKTNQPLRSISASSPKPKVNVLSVLSTETQSQKVDEEPTDSEFLSPSAAGVNNLPGGSIGFNEKAFGPKSSPQVEIVTGDRLNHKYTYNNSRLILIGDFANKIYELIELKVDGGKMLFIYYNSKFYPIEDGTIDPKSLKEIEDQILLQELMSLRKKTVE